MRRSAAQSAGAKDAKILQFRLPYKMVERASGGGKQKSCLQFYLLLLQKAIYRIWEQKQKILQS